MLTEKEIRSFKRKERIYKVSDGSGLYIMVQPNGSKLWRVNYRFEGKQKTASLGMYPKVSLKDARNKTIEIKKILADGFDPSQHKLVDEPSGDLTFGKVAEAWYETKCSGWDVSTKKRARSILDIWVLPSLGRTPINSIDPLTILRVCNKASDQGKIETSHRIRSQCSRIFRYGVILRYCASDPAKDIVGVLKTAKKRHFASIIEPEKVGQLMRAIDGFHGSIIVKTALKCSALWFCRPGEVRSLEWADVDFDDAMISIPAERMKMNRDHLIPMSTQSIELLKALRPLTQSSKYVFPSARGDSRCMSDNAVRMAMRTMGYAKEDMTAHGFRAMARTLLDEVLDYRVEWIEHQLAHEVRDATGRAYNRTSFIEQRRGMMQGWADYLDELKGRG